MRVYLAGPMRGYADHNYPAFMAAAAQLRELGYRVFNPAEHAPQPPPGTEPTQADIRIWMRQDLTWICEHADAVVVLPGWELSYGARAEVVAAWAIGLPVYLLADVLAGNLKPVPAAVRTAETSGVGLIAAERQRQISGEGWTPEHDDQHTRGQLAGAAAAYAVAAARMSGASIWTAWADEVWPWSRRAYKPVRDDPIGTLVKAGALIAAEIDRLQRTPVTEDCDHA